MMEFLFTPEVKSKLLEIVGISELIMSSYLVSPYALSPGNGPVSVDLSAIFRLVNPKFTSSSDLLLSSTLTQPVA